MLTALVPRSLQAPTTRRRRKASAMPPISVRNPRALPLHGNIEVVAPNPLGCVEQRLARFADLEPGSSLANYYYAMALWKGQAQPADQQVVDHVERLLNKAVTIDAKCGEAYLQLGILYYSQRNFEKAIDSYTKAIAAKPELVDAHYRLAVAYDRIGETAEASKEFQLHDALKKQQAAEVERKRREVKQFLVGGQPTYRPRIEKESIRSVAAISRSEHMLRREGLNVATIHALREWLESDSL